MALMQIKASASQAGQPVPSRALTQRSGWGEPLRRYSFGRCAMLCEQGHQGFAADR